jgi:hypothetical protein
VFIHRNWIEVDPKYAAKEQNGSLIKQDIPVLNSYAPVINLQDLSVYTYDAMVAKELGLPYNRQREEWQTEIYQCGVKLLSSHSYYT